MLHFPERQKGKFWESLKKQCSFGIWGPMENRYFHLVFKWFIYQRCWTHSEQWCRCSFFLCWNLSCEKKHLLWKVSPGVQHVDRTDGLDAFCQLINPVSRNLFPIHRALVENVVVLRVSHRELHKTLLHIIRQRHWICRALNNTLMHKVLLNPIEKFNFHLTVNTHHVHYKHQSVITVDHTTAVCCGYHLKRKNAVVRLKRVKNYCRSYACLLLGLRY